MTKPTLEDRISLEMMASISAMRIDSFEREKIAKRKLDIRKIMMNITDSSNYYEFLKTNHIDLLNIMEADALVIYEGQDGGKLIYGSSDIIPSAEGFTTLIKASKDNNLLAWSEFTYGLGGDGAGVVFFRNQYITVAIVRKSLKSDVHWGGKPDGNYH